APAEDTGRARPRARAGADDRVRDPPAEQPARASLSHGYARRLGRDEEHVVPALGGSGTAGARSTARGEPAHRKVLPRRHADARRLLPGAAALQCPALPVRSLRLSHAAAHRAELQRAARVPARRPRTPAGRGAREVSRATRIPFGERAPAVATI